MADNNENNKAKIKQLETDMKIAFKEESFDAVKKLAEEINTIEPDNRMATRLLEKMDEAKVNAKKKENAEKIKQYLEMIKKMFKDGNLENVRKLAGELKEFDKKTADQWLQKADAIEADLKKKQNAEKIKSVSQDIKTAFKEGNYDQVEKFCSNLKELDPGDKSGEKWLEKVEKTKDIELKKQNADKIKSVSKDIKIAFKEGSYDQVEKFCADLKELDSGDKAPEKWLKKVEEAKISEVKKINADKINELEKRIKGAFKEEQFDNAKKSIEELVKIDPESSLAGKFLAKIAKITEKDESKKQKTEQEQEAPKEEAKTENVFMAKEEEAPVEKQKTEQEQEAPVAVAPVIAAQVKDAVKGPETSEAKPIVDTKKAEGAEAVTKTEIKEIKPVSEEAAEPVTADESTVKGAEPVESEDKGNVFTRMFKGKGELESSSKSIIDTIVEKSSDKEDKKEEKNKEEKVGKGEGVAFLKLSKAFLQFGVAFIVLSAGFFYTQNIDINNTVLGLFGVEENYASRLHAANTMLEAKNSEEFELTKENNRYKKGYNNRYEGIISQIIDNRLNWPDILAKINEVADFIYERNVISQYIKYNSFSFDVEKRLITVSGSLSDPLGKNLTKMAELEEAFRYYPKDKSNPNDTTQPYFSDFKEFKSLSKSYDKKTGKYTSTFQLSFTLNPESEK